MQLFTPNCRGVKIIKQRITVEDLQQLRPEQKEKLREWWKPAFTDHFLYEKDDGFKGCHIVEYYDCDGEIATLGTRTHCLRKPYCLPILDIGQMIEILKQKDPYLLGKLLGEVIIPDIVVDWKGQEMELADALFEVLRSVL